MKNVKLAFSIKFIQGFFFFFFKEKLQISMVMDVYWFYYDFSVGLYIYMCAHTSVFTVEGTEALK